MSLISDWAIILAIVLGFAGCHAIDTYKVVETAKPQAEKEKCK